MASQPDWRTDDVDALIEAFVALDTVDRASAFLRDLCTLGELHDMAQRWAVVRLLDTGLHYGEISRRTGASTATITRIASWLRHGEGGYRAVLEQRKARAAGAASAASATSGPSRYPAGTER